MRDDKAILLRCKPHKDALLLPVDFVGCTMISSWMTQQQSMLGLSKISTHASSNTEQPSRTSPNQANSRSRELGHSRATVKLCFGNLPVTGTSVSNDERSLDAAWSDTFRNSLYAGVI